MQDDVERLKALVEMLKVEKIMDRLRGKPGETRKRRLEHQKQQIALRPIVGIGRVMASLMLKA